MSLVGGDELGRGDGGGTCLCWMAEDDPDLNVLEGRLLLLLLLVHGEDDRVVKAAPAVGCGEGGRYLQYVL